MSLEEVQQNRAKEEADDKVREAQAILLFLEKPEAFIRKNCDWCHGDFLTSYQYVSVCSTHCRALSLERVGITWNPSHLPWERWTRAQIPIEYSIPPAALQVLLELAEAQQERQILHHDQDDGPHEEISSILPSNNEPQEARDVALLPLAEIEVEDFFR